MVGISGGFGVAVRCWCRRCKAEGSIDVLLQPPKAKLLRTIGNHRELQALTDEQKCACGCDRFMLVIEVGFG